MAKVSHAPQDFSPKENSMNNKLIKAGAIVALAGAAVFSLSACSTATSTPESSETTEGAGSTVIAPVIVDVADLDGTTVDVQEGNFIDVNVPKDSEALWTAKIADDMVLSFTPGGTDGSAVIEGDELKTLAIKGSETISGPAASAHAMQVATGGTKSAVKNASSAAPQNLTDPAGWKWGDAHRAQFADFINSIREERPALVEGEAARAAVALIHAIYESARTGLPVSL
jgi:predicted dehydrogenase